MSQLRKDHLGLKHSFVRVFAPIRQLADGVIAHFVRDTVKYLPRALARGLTDKEINEGF